ncbi:MAG: hypothetical protein AAGE18_08940 [Pseudomonadota bacterium]
MHRLDEAAYGPELGFTPVPPVSEDERDELLDEVFGRIVRNLRRIEARLRDIGYRFECEEPTPREAISELFDPDAIRKIEEEMAARLGALSAEDRAAAEARLGEMSDFMQEFERRQHALAAGEPSAPIPPTPTISPASDATKLAIASARARHGRFPEALQWFSERIGNVDFRQKFSTFGAREGVDPVVANLGDWDPFCFDLELFGRLAGTEEDPGIQLLHEGGQGQLIEFAPDFCIKANVSGGDPYHVILPNPRADPVVHHWERRVPFMTFLRATILRGGFRGAPMLTVDRGHGWRGTVEVEPRTFLPDHPVFASLADGLEPF